MTRFDFDFWNGYMLDSLSDGSHDREHVRRVLYNALEIAKGEAGADMDVLVCACLLHDIGRPEQFADPALCHARVGAEKAERFLAEHGYSPEFARRVADAIRTHRYRRGEPPESVEARILFDADKLDACGAMGIARTFLYKGGVGDPIYTLGENGMPSDGSDGAKVSFFQEYKFKLEKLYDRFYTVRGRELALERRQAAEDFYRALLAESRRPYLAGREELEKLLKEE